MSNSIYRNSRNDKQYRAATGLSRAEFAVLYASFAPFYTAKKSNPHARTNQPVLTDKHEALFFILHYYKAYPTLQNLGLYFDISEASASNYIELLKPCLRAALHHQRATVVRLFKNQQEFDDAFAGVTDLMIDVTEIPIERADCYEVQKNQYSGKKNFIP